MSRHTRGVASSLPTQVQRCSLWSFALQEETFHILDYNAYFKTPLEKQHFKASVSKSKWEKRTETELIFRVCAKILKECEWSYGKEKWLPLADLQVFQVFLDAPESVCAALQLADFSIGQGHVDNAAHTAAVQHTGQTQVNLLTDAIHAL